jgi:hypothetical protein
MASRKSSDGLDLQYVRIPITSERPPDFADISELMDLVLRADSSSTVMVVNCQLGRGRSTLTSVSAYGKEIHFIQRSRNAGLDYSHPTMAKGKPVAFAAVSSNGTSLVVDVHDF